jgi:outer membrane protein assembly factor BamB
VAMRARTGTEIWRQHVLLHRGLSPPAITDDSVIVGDYQGYLHWLDKATGELQAREHAGKTRISTVPLVVDDKVMIIDDRGDLRAYRTRPLKGKASKAGPAPAS